MHLFKYRNLALSCLAYFLTLLAAFYLPSVWRIILLLVPIFSAASLLICFIFGNRRGLKSVFTRLFPIFAFMALALLVSVLSFNKIDKKYELCDGEKHNIEADILSVESALPYRGVYIAKLKAVDDEYKSFKIIFVSGDDRLCVGDRVSAEVVFNKTAHADFGFSEYRHYLQDGIVISATAKSYLSSKGDGFSFKVLLAKINSFLDARLKNALNSDTYPLISALFLGNKDALGSDVSRNFTRIGLSHVLALSGMHLSIIAAMLSFVIDRLRMNRILKSVLLILSVFMYTGITGFSSSVLRAAIMIIVSRLLIIFGKRIDGISALFASVAIICVISPYSIFSTSLILSFLALLGCLITTRLIYRSKRLRRIKTRLLRYIAFSMLNTLGVTLITVFFVFVSFGYFSVLSPFSNIILVPVFNILLFLCPFLLLFSTVPVISVVLIKVCEWISFASLWLSQLFASAKGILIYFKNPAQIISIVLVSVLIICLISLGRKFIKPTLILMSLCLVVFTLGSIGDYIMREGDDYISISSSGEDDYVFIEHLGKMYVIDISRTNPGSIYFLKDSLNYIGYSEIEGYVICDYSHVTELFVSELKDRVCLSSLYIVAPKTEKENICLELIKEALGNEIPLTVFENEVDIGITSIEFSEYDMLDRSERKCVCFSYVLNGCKISYLGASAYEISGYFPEDNSFDADILIFGSYGPPYKRKFSYKTSNMKYGVFLGESKDFASDEMKNGDHSCIFYEISPIKFKLNKESY